MSTRRIKDPWMRKVAAIAKEMAPCRLDDVVAKTISLIPPHAHRECKRLTAARRVVVRAAGRKYVVVDGILRLKTESDT